MNYEDAFRHYKEGTATEEEKAFVQSEIARAKALSTLLDDQGLTVKSPKIKEADAEEVRKAKTDFLWRRVIVGLLSVVAVLVIIAAVLGGVFGSAATYAKKSVAVNIEEAVILAEEFAYNDAANFKGTKPFEGENNFMAERVGDIDKKFQFENNLKDSYYVYRVEVKGYDTVNQLEWEYEIDVNAKTGVCSVYKFEREFERNFRY